MGVEVRAPDGRVWKVRRALGWPRWRDTGDVASVFSGLAYADVGNPLVGVVVGIVLGIVFAFVVLLFLPLILFVVELVLLVPAVLLLVRPWRVVASTAGPPPARIEWRVRGWRGSRDAVATIAHRAERGEFPAPETAD